MRRAQSRPPAPPSLRGGPKGRRSNPRPSKIYAPLLGLLNQKNRNSLFFMEEIGYVYILSNWTGSVLYTGVTSNLKDRVNQHRNNLGGGFTKKYYTNRLVYYEVCPDIVTAILREKQFKGGSRKRKIKAIESMNPNWEDLYDKI